MRIKLLISITILFMMSGFAMAQTYSIIIKGGHLIDPKNNIDAVMDLAINDGKIALVAKSIDEKKGSRLLMLRGCMLHLVLSIFIRMFSLEPIWISNIWMGQTPLFLMDLPFG